MVILQKFCLKMAHFNLIFVKIISVEKAVQVYYSGLLYSHLYYKGFINASITKTTHSQNWLLPGKSTPILSLGFLLKKKKKLFILSGDCFRCLLTSEFLMFLASLAF